MSSIDDVHNETSENFSTFSQSLIKSFAVKEKDSEESIPNSYSASMNKVTPNLSVYKGNYVDVPLGSKYSLKTNRSNQSKVRKNENDKCICRII